MAEDKSESVKFIVVGVVGLTVLGLAYFGIIKPILDTAGITNSKEDRKGGKAEKKISKEGVLTPRLYAENQMMVTISSGRASQLASNVYNGKWGGCFGTCDDEPKGVSGITGAGSKVNISYVADKFNKAYNKNMHDYLFSYIEPENWTTIDDYIDKIKMS